MGKRLAYTLLGFSIGLLVALVLGSVAGKSFGMGGVGIALSFGGLAVAIAEWRGKVKSIEEINRPVTLFPRTPSNTPD
jgi:O-antigen/teichoic acid export membrane protein